MEHLEALRARRRVLEQELATRVPTAGFKQMVHQNTDLHVRLHLMERVIQHETRQRQQARTWRQRVDTQLLNKRLAFTGTHADWKTCSFDFEACANAVHSRFGDLMQQALTAGAVLTVQDELDVTLSRQLYHILVSLICDNAKAEFATVPRGGRLTT